MEQADTRTKLLIGEEGAAVLKARTVCVLGIGGVGSFCVEALARSGIGRLILVDGDVVAPSNLNRQLMAVQETIGKAKTEAMAERIRQYRSDIEIRCVNRFYDASLNEELFCEPIDFVVDAIDTLSSKRDCIEYCLLHQIPFISSMGMANRLDPTKLTIMELMKTTYDPLAKVMRSMMRKSVSKVRSRSSVRWNSRSGRHASSMKMERPARNRCRGKLFVRTCGSRSCLCIVCGPHPVRKG